MIEDIIEDQRRNVSQRLSEINGYNGVCALCCLAFINEVIALHILEGNIKEAIYMIEEYKSLE